MTADPTHPDAGRSPCPRAETSGPGVVESVSGKDAPNKLIHGENLAALKSLLPEYRGQVALVYIDPPFATNANFRIGNGRTATVSSSNGDALAYSDQLRGADYLAFLRARLILLRELLADNGSLYLHLDYKMGHYVKVLLDEVFGQKNFRNDITRVKSNPKNFPRKGYGNIKDLILFYAKSREIIWNDPQVPLSESDKERLFRKVDAAGRRYTTIPLHAPGETINGNTGQEWQGLRPPRGRHWRSEPAVLEELDRQGLIEWSANGVPRKKIYADEKAGKRMQDIWEFKDPPYPAYPTQKSLELLNFIIAASSNPGDLVLDCFCGSGTTLVAAQSQGRRWIGIDNSAAAIAAAQARLAARPAELFAPAGYQFLTGDL